MHDLALARYRLLTTIRKSTWIFGLLLFVALLPHLTPFFATFQRELFFQANAEHYVLTTSLATLLTFVLHWIIVISACSLFGKDSTGSGSDLMATVPVRPASLFHGDVLGIFATGMILHLSVLPLLALNFALTSFDSVAFFWIECVVILTLIVVSAAASWRLHARPGSALQAGAAWSLGLLILLIVRLGTRWIPFRDSALAFLVGPSPHSWGEVVAGIERPLLLVGWLLVAGAAAWMFFRTHAIYTLERSPRE